MSNIIKPIATATKMFFKRHGSKILLGAGIAANGAAVVTAVRATTKLPEQISDNLEKIKLIKKEIAESTNPESTELKKKELTSQYVEIGKKTIKAYLPSVGLFVGGTGMIIGGHSIVVNQLATTSTILATTQKSYDNYRKRVIDAIGEDKEHKIYNNLKEDKTVEVEEVDPKTGEVKKVKEKSLQANIDYYDYNKFIWGPEWLCSPYLIPEETRLDFLVKAEGELSTRLRREGFLFLSDVIDYLGLDRDRLTDEQLKALRTAGWVYDPTDDEIDSFVDLGLRLPSGNYTPEAKQLSLGIHDDIVLSMNCCGNIVNSPREYNLYMNGRRRRGRR